MTALAAGNDSAKELDALNIELAMKLSQWGKDVTFTAPANPKSMDDLGMAVLGLLSRPPANAQPRSPQAALPPRRAAALPGLRTGLAWSSRVAPPGAANVKRSRAHNSGRLAPSNGPVQPGHVTP